MNKIMEGLREDVHISGTDRLTPGSVVAWQGFQIKLGERDKHWVTRGGANPIPGAACFETISDAKKGIAALIVADTILTGVKRDAAAKSRLFWSLIELSR